MSTKARQRLADAYLTVVQAAEYLAVHPSTIRRWIDRGRLPAYRLGDKRIGVRQSDLARLVTPRDPRHGQRGGVTHPERSGVPRLTRDEQQRGLQILADLERFRDELAARHGTLTPESWELLDQSRDERTRDLVRAVEE